MFVTLRYPVVAEGKTVRGADRFFCGTTTTPCEIEEMSAGEMSPVVSLEGGETVFSHGENCYRARKGSIRRGDVIDVHEFRQSGQHVFPFASEFETVFRDKAHYYDHRRFTPKFDGYTLDKYYPNELYRHFIRAGEFSDGAREFNSADHDRWRERAIRYMGNYKIVDGKLFERCHEPLLVAVPGDVYLSDTSIFSEHVYPFREHLTEWRHDTDEWKEPTGFGRFSDAHAFPLDRMEEARGLAMTLAPAPRDPSDQAAGRSGGFEIHAAVSSAAGIADLETVRFLKFNVVAVDRFNAKPQRKNEGDPTPSQRAYSMSATGVKRSVIAHEFDPSGRGIATMNAHLERIHACAVELDYGFSRVRDTLAHEALVANTRVALDLRDTAPIDLLSVEPAPSGPRVPR